MTPLKKLAGQTATYGLSSMLGRLLNYLLVPLYTTQFLTHEYGVVSELYAYVAFCAVLITYGMETAYFRYAEKEGNKDSVYSTTLISLIVSSSLFLLVTLLCASPIANWMGYAAHPEYISWFALILALDSVAAISFAHLRAAQKAISFVSVKLFGIGLNIGLNLFFILYCPWAIENSGFLAEWIGHIYSAGIGVGYVFIANLIASTATLLLLLPIMARASWRFDIVLWRKMAWFALPLLVAGMAGVVNETLDRAILKYLLPGNVNAMAELGIYGACYKLSIVMTLFVQAFRFAAEPFFFAQEKKKDAPVIYAETTKWFTSFCAFIFLGVMLFIDVFKHFIGVSFREGLAVVPILLLANLFLGLLFNFSIWYKLTEKTHYGAWLAIFGAGVTIVLNVALVPHMGYMASAWATLACYASMAVLSYALGQHIYPIPYNLRIMFSHVFLALAIYGASAYWALSLSVNALLLAAFLLAIWGLEKGKIGVISSPK